MDLNVFGFNITKASKKPTTDIVPEVKKERLDGSLEIAATGGSHAVTTHFDSAYSNKIELINLYRTMALDPTVSDALEDIINETVVIEGDKDIIALSLDDTSFSENIRKDILEAHEKILNLLRFNTDAQDIFKKWYVDGRIYAYMVLPKGNEDRDITKSTKTGIEEIRILDPRNVELIREIDENTNEEFEYFLYTDVKHRDLIRENVDPGHAGQAAINADKMTIKKDAMVFVPSGEYDLEGNNISFMHHAIKPYNQLSTLEDYSVIYRMVRSTERRVFYIDVGELPKTKAEQYMRSIIQQHQNKSKYDAKTGKMTESSNMRSMLEDIWLPRRDGQRATEVDTLQGGTNLGEMDDIEYFKKKLYMAMHIPQSRLDVDSRFALGRSSDITRDELKFTRFIDKVRRRFVGFLFELLKTEVILNNTLTSEEWDDEKNNIRFEFTEDSHFAEMKNTELLGSRIESLSNINEYIGTFFSVEQVQKEILRRTDEDIKEVRKQIEQERKDGIIKDDDDEDSGGFR